MKLYRNATILIVDDDEDDYFILSGYLRDVPDNDFTITWAPTYADGRRQIATGTFDIAFVDYRLGARSGVDFLKEVRHLHHDTPIVLLTGQGNYEVDIEAMELGAVDYLIKAELTTEKAERCIRYTIDRAANIRALRHSEQKYRSIFENSKDIIFMADAGFCITDINDAAFQLLGMDRQTLIGTPLPDLCYREQDRAQYYEALEARHQITDSAIDMRRADGTPLHCILSFTVNESTPGAVVIQGIIHDVTHLRKAEKTTLQNEKLAATGRLVRTLAHEVRNPLNNIMMSSDQLSDPDMPDDEKKLYLDIIKRNSLRINGLITELLHSNVPRDNMRTRCSIQDILAGVYATAADRITLRRMRYIAHIPQEQLYIAADKENLKIALLNIVINAVEAMEEGHGVLTINVSGSDDRITLTIADNGCGISEEHINHIFEPYFTRKRTGTGLGLAFTLNIIRAHNAILEVSSVQGAGTTFTINFPLFAPGAASLA